MSELALKLIWENIEKHQRGEDATFLDLGNCGITEVPATIGKCTWLKELSLSNSRWEWGRQKWNRIFSYNPGLSNNITNLPTAFLYLRNLNKLWISGESNQKFSLFDLSNLSGLKKLQELYCSDTNVYDLSPLHNLQHLQIVDCSYSNVKDLFALSSFNQLKMIDCNNTRISDLSSLSNLVKLQTIVVSDTLVFDLSTISNLNNLKELSIDKTQVADLSPIAKLVNLKELRFNQTKVINLAPLILLKNLHTLYFGGTSIIDLSPLSKLKNLRSLVCWDVPATNISPVSNLKKLDWIVLSRSLITDLSPLKALTELRGLGCQSLEIEDWSFLYPLRNLQFLGLSNTKFSDLNRLLHLTALKRIDLDNTPISDISLLSTLPNLEQISLSGTQIADISSLVLNRKNDIPVIWNFDKYNGKGPYIHITNCPLIIPPTEIAMESPQAVRDYFEELGDDGQKLNEVKVIFLGEASAGKTSLVKRLLAENFDSKETQTHGIRIRKAPFTMNDGDAVTAHLWDFGGQEVMHATHQFFLSQRSIYVLLLNSRNDDQAEKWLKHAASFGGNSPVLIVLNKIDENPSFEVNRKALTEKYPQIRDFFRLSAKTDKGIDEFREALRCEIDTAPTRCTPFPTHWLEVKERFSNMEADYIESSEYRKVCETCDVTRQFSQDVLLQFLHDLGVVINFRNLKYFDTQILNPLWLTNGVYRIINSELVANAGGLLREGDFDAVINDPRYKQGNTTDRVFEYPKNKLQYIIRVMEEFELCFMLDARTYVVPQLLPVQEPDFKPEGATLRFVIHFPDFMPDSLFPRLMVKLHTYIAGSQRWRSGMVLHKPSVFQALARVRWDKEDQKILVEVCGEERRRFLSFIRETVKEIVEDFANLSFNELVPIPESKEYLDYEGLVEAEKAKKEEIFVWQVKKDLKIKELLDGVEESSMRNEVEQLPVKAFVSYSHKDLEYLKELRTALAPLVRLQKLQLWDDRDIDAGETWEKVIFQQLEEADIVLCLVSADFVASDFCYKKEFEVALAAHRKNEKTIVPVMLRKTDWSGLPLSEIQGAPGEWITSAPNKDEAWSKVSESLRPALEQAKLRKKAILDKRMGH